MGRCYAGGGSLALASLIDKAGEALYQDFQEFYQLNLIHMIRDDVPPTEIMLLIRGLKMGSRFAAQMSGSQEFVGWEVIQYQIANLTDAVNYNTFVLTSANSKRKPKAPKPTYRPQKERRQATNPFRTQLEMVKKRKLTQAKPGDHQSG